MYHRVVPASYISKIKDVPAKLIFFRFRHWCSCFRILMFYWCFFAASLDAAILAAPNLLIIVWFFIDVFRLVKKCIDALAGLFFERAQNWCTLIFLNFSAIRFDINQPRAHTITACLCELIGGPLLGLSRNLCQTSIGQTTMRYFEANGNDKKCNYPYMWLWPTPVLQPGVFRTIV